ncbi:hypothetical protein OQA88_5155 [Cercophora sp. LCS_1]
MKLLALLSLLAAARALTIGSDAAADFEDVLAAREPSPEPEPLTLEPTSGSILLPRANTAITAFSLVTTVSLGSAGCSFSIKTNADLEDSNVGITCEASSNGGVIRSPSNSNFAYTLSCNTRAGSGPNGQNECAVRRRVCLIVPLLGTYCANVQLGAANTTQCPRKRKRQNPPQSCGVLRGTNLPQDLLK